MKNTSRKKRYTKQYRKSSSTQWIRNFKGKNIVEEYSRWYGVNLICAIKELRDKGEKIDNEYELEVRKKVEAKRIARQINKDNREKKLYDELSDSRFAYIAGYTSGGAAYGLTYEEMLDEELEDDFKGIFEN